MHRKIVIPEGGFVGRHVNRAERRKILEDQNHRCRICRREIYPKAESIKHRAVLDHCHKTGVVRGFLCSQCNMQLGNINEDIEWLERAIAHLRSVERIEKTGGDFDWETGEYK